METGRADTQRRQTVSDWYHRYNAQLRRFLGRGIASQADVQDLAQEVYLRLLRVENLEAIEAPQAYLYRIAVHVLAEWRARQRREQQYDADEVDELVATDEPSAIAQQAQVRQHLSNTLAKLPPASRAVLILHSQHHLTYPEIAQHLGVSERMVKRYIVKSYAQLRQSLAHKEVLDND